MMPIAAKRLILAATCLGLVAMPGFAAAPAATLVGRAVLPADTFTTGPTSGRYLGTQLINGRQGPFTGRHPVQGFSAVVANGDGTFWVLGDNGFGYIENSADHELRMYHIRPRFKTAQQPDGGQIEVLGHVALHDPDHRLPWAITHQFTRTRVLTGADLDPESFQRAPDGTWWIGDEFGPFLVHVDARGKVLEAPVALPDPERKGQAIRSPQNPFLIETAPLRVMNALRAHAQAHGAPAPLLSPYFGLLDDQRPDTALTGQREEPGAAELYDLKLLQAAGHAVVPWTVNDPTAMRALLAMGVSGLISDRPDRLYEAVAGFDADGDGRPGDYLTRDGLIDPARFDAQGHRGARDLRPENTLPAFEAALDALVNTLETDLHLTRDGVAVLSHDAELTPAKARRADGAAWPASAQGRPRGLRLRDLSFAELQRDYLADVLLRDALHGPTQQNGPAFSPAAVAFAGTARLKSPYVVPSLEQLVAFTRYYVAYYRAGAGASHPAAKRRALNAERVRFNLETKLSPESEQRGETPGPAPFARAVGTVVRRAGIGERTTIQSFDYRSLLVTQAEFPELGTAWLLGPEAPFAMAGGATPSESALWRDSIAWPQGVSRFNAPPRAQKTGGFEGMAISPDGRRLYPMLEKPLLDGPAGQLPIFEFDLAARRYTDRRWHYAYEPGATSVADFVLASPDQGLAIEREDAQGRTDALKRIYRVRLGAPGTQVEKTLVADLTQLDDPHDLSSGGLPGDVGLGRRFALPYFTIEGLVVLGPRKIGVVTDNNYPFSVGRHIGSAQPDDSEFVVIDTNEPLIR